MDAYLNRKLNKNQHVLETYVKKNVFYEVTGVHLYLYLGDEYKLYLGSHVSTHHIMNIFVKINIDASWECFNILFGGILIPQPQLDNRCSSNSSVSVKPRGNLAVIKKDEHKTVSVGLLDTKIYCHCLFTGFGMKRGKQYLRCVRWFNKYYKPCESIRTIKTKSFLLYWLGSHLPWDLVGHLPSLFFFTPTSMTPSSAMNPFLMMVYVINK